jgi:hypothetical protein
MLSDKNIKRFIGVIIWNFCETMRIDVGRLAPIIFGWMIGSKGKRINKS